MHDLHEEIKELIIESLDLEELEITDIDSDAPLFGDGLGLDSIDALELGLALKKRYSIKLESNSDEAKMHFYSVTTLADFVRVNAVIV